MTTSTLYLFVDTNLFIQCRSLEDLDWSPWRAFEEVRLIVSTPVLREIDGLKKTRGGRVQRRAREASAMFRKMHGRNSKIDRAGPPRIALAVELQLKPAQDLEGDLDYSERDDQLIGTIHAFAGSDQSKDVRLLTHDAILLHKARGLGLTVHEIPDEWLRPAETTETERKVAALVAENSRLKAAEPCVSVRCEGSAGTAIEPCYEATYTRYAPLTEAEVESLMQRLMTCFPLATDFAPLPPLRPIMGATQTPPFPIPAPDEEIRKYREEDYPRWLARCQRALRSHHRTLQAAMPLPRFAFLAGNSGARPAEDVLVTIEAHGGGFRIMPPPSDDTNEDREGEDEASDDPEPGTLPPPPVAPRGHWARYLGDVARIGAGTRRMANLLQDLVGRENAYASPLRESLMKSLAPPLLAGDLPWQRDPNAFYYKSGRPSEPQTSFALECTQWRHGDKEEPFIGEIRVPTDEEAVKGLLVCRIEAANLSKPVSCRVPVRIAIMHVSAFASARDMVEALADDHGFQVTPSLPPGH